MFFSRNPGVVWICECIYFYVFLHVRVCLFRAAPEAYGGSQAGVKWELQLLAYTPATATPELYLPPAPQLTAMLDP